MARPTAMDIVLSRRARESAAPGGVQIMRSRETRWEGRQYRVALSIPGMTSLPIDASGTGARLAQVVAEDLTAHFQRGEDADGHAIATSSATVERRRYRRKQWAARASSIGGYYRSVVEAKARVRGKRKRAQLSAVGADDRGLVLRFLLGAGWYDPHRSVGVSVLEGTGAGYTGRETSGTGEVRVRNQRGARLFPPLADGAQRGGLESGLFANSLSVRFMGGRTGAARVGIFFAAQREEFVKWAERQGYVLADVPAEADAKIDAMLARQADGLAGGADWRRAGRTALDVLRGAASLVEWAFL